MLNPVYRLEIRGRLFGQLMINVHHYEMLRPPSPDRASTLLLDGWLSSQATVVKPWSRDVTIERITVLSQTPKENVYYGDFDSVSSPVMGAFLAKDSLPQHITVSIRKGCLLHGRSFRGHNLLFGWPTEFTENGMVRAADADNYLSQWLDFIKRPIRSLVSTRPVAYATFTPILWTGRRLTLDQYLAFPSKPITRTSYRPALGAFRRRQIGIGA
jgi:hypothetical protein